MTKRLTTEEFIAKAKRIHKNKYKYSKVVYKNALSLVIITCPKHGDFYQRALHHLEGHGCKKCSDLNLRKIKASSKDIFINRSKEVHGDKYNYSKVEYINAKTKVEIICPIHGSFLLTPDVHLKGCGCPKCSHEKLNKNRKLTIEQFILNSRKIHGYKYDYSKVKFDKAKDEVFIICPIHGEFKLRASNHLSGRGCPKCKQSHGEEYIELILKENNVNYISLYKINIDSLIISRGITQIDFYLPDYNIFIEYNGIQHYIPQEYFGGKLKFDNYLIPRDTYIKKYCYDNNILLIEISYKYKTKDEILTYLKENVAEIFIK